MAYRKRNNTLLPSHVEMLQDAIKHNSDKHLLLDVLEYDKLTIGCHTILNVHDSILKRAVEILYINDLSPEDNIVSFHVKYSTGQEEDIYYFTNDEEAIRIRWHLEETFNGALTKYNMQYVYEQLYALDLRKLKKLCCVIFYETTVESMKDVSKNQLISDILDKDDDGLDHVYEEDGKIYVVVREGKPGDVIEFQELLASMEIGNNWNHMKW